MTLKRIVTDADTAVSGDFSQVIQELIS